MRSGIGGKRLDIEGPNDEQIAWVIHAARQSGRPPQGEITGRAGLELADEERFVKRLVGERYGPGVLTRLVDLGPLALGDVEALVHDLGEPT